MNTLIKKILQETKANENPYFVALRDKTFSKDDFIETQIQFFLTVVFFSRPMAALAARIPQPHLRMEIVRNIWEEHGEGNLNRVHGATFQELLSKLADISTEDIEKRTLWPEVRQFNTTLSGACVLDEHLVGCAMMGMIERMFCEISSWMGKGMVRNGWLKPEQMVHYNIHEDLDIKHSQDFFNVLEPSWNENLENQYFIEQGLRLGATAFNSLYEGLYRQRERRWLRATSGPHVRS